MPLSRLRFPHRAIHTTPPNPIARIEELGLPFKPALPGQPQGTSTSTGGGEREPVSGPGKFDFPSPPSPPSSTSTSSNSNSNSNSTPSSSSSLPVPYPPTPPLPPRAQSQKPPFDTHAFIRHLTAHGFPEGRGKAIMRVALEEVGRKRWEAEGRGISRGDLENQAYLFRAALSELRSESSSRSRASSASIRSTLTALRREVDSLSQKVKEDVDTLRHEIQMEVNTRKNESRLETKVPEVEMEEVNHKSTITIGELRTEIEQAKWNNTRRGVGVIAFFVVFIIAFVELLPKKKPALALPAPQPTTAKEEQRETVGLPDLREWERKDVEVEVRY
ncbi:hypothetical protein DACRYDRAFT_111613 [Dacryopinax primogenitus]|uniref:DUF1640-domain-containing protein n=1 Tax=Dacryopinax primogenitus (strain DJM 731) TaxID=1858805 RepID=M5FNJ8_DACPD|nr:uncharacterized protein DACRYDRAFT_111613 [Dacryopinax primogenitus]EJT97570.1 hypothetical protein DACRYDRAFT_111613 [Dacryopinax primogenitus]